MTLNKNTKMILGVGAVAIVGYLLWKNQQKPKAFANLLSSGGGTFGGGGRVLTVVDKCKKCQVDKNGECVVTNVNGQNLTTCCMYGVVGANGSETKGCGTASS